jgi:hypothetical protein
MGYNKRIATLIEQECKSYYQTYWFNPFIECDMGTIVNIHLDNKKELFMTVFINGGKNIRRIDDNSSNIIFHRLIDDLHTKYDNS